MAKLGSSSAFQHALQNAFLIFLSLALLPLDTVILVLSLVLARFDLTRYSSKRYARTQAATVLVTGVGMTKGLALARLFHRAGYTVIGADFEAQGALACGRFSRALERFYPLRAPNSEDGAEEYINDLVRIVREHNVLLWVSCSGVASAIDDAMAQETVTKLTKCKAVQFNVTHTALLHEKHSFISHVSALGLTVPETHTVTSHAAAEKFLSPTEHGSRKYILKCVGLDDSSRADMTLFPRSTRQETSEALSQLKISSANPWIIQQFVGGREYCTHALVIRGKVKAFVACPSDELLMHYEALDACSPLSRAMLQFTEIVASNGGPTFTGHMSFDFMVENRVHENEHDVVLYPIECNPRAHTAVALFNDNLAMTDAYMTLLAEDDKTDQEPVVTPSNAKRYYWVGHDLVAKILVPALKVATLQAPISDLIAGLWLFVVHVLTWKDGTYEVWDPLPWWYLYHGYWPAKFLHSLWTGQYWSRVNVSTTKMFML